MMASSTNRRISSYASTSADSNNSGLSSTGRPGGSNFPNNADLNPDPTMHGSGPRGSRNDLPAWIFDVDALDEVDLQNRTLMQELEIDPAQVLAEAAWTLLAPLYRLAGKRIGEKHPLVDRDKVIKKVGGNNNNNNNNNSSSSSSNGNSDNNCENNNSSTPPGNSTNQVDFWGPCFIVSIYVALLWLVGVKHASWVYLVWVLAAVFNHLVVRVWSSVSALPVHLSVLGYSILPVILSSCLLLAINTTLGGPSQVVAASLQFVAAAYATFGALLAYIAIFPVPDESKHRLALLIPPVLLMQLYFLSILPIRHVAD